MGASEHLYLTSRLTGVLRGLDAASDGVGSLPAELRGRVEVRLRTSISRLREEALGCVEALHDGTAHPADAWATLHAVAFDAGVVTSECSALVKGARARADEVAGWPCGVADALVDELVARTPYDWDSFTIHADEEQLHGGSRVIGVRGPGTSVWDLAIVAHELGHLVGPALQDRVGTRTRHPLDDLADECDARGSAWHWLQEMFADAFAVYVLGPAYAFSCVVEAFDPLLAAVPYETHPPLSLRVGMLTKALRLHPPAQSEWATKVVERLWDEQLQQAEVATPSAVPNDPADQGGPTDPDGLIEAWPDIDEQVLELLTRYLPVSRFESGADAELLAVRLRGPAHAPFPQASLATVLNAAWYARLEVQRQSDIEAVDDAARTALQQLARR